MAISLPARPNLELIEQNYEQWRTNPDSLDGQWAAFFEGFELGTSRPPTAGTNGAGKPGTAESPLAARVENLVSAYRALGHTIALLDPLSKTRPENPLLALKELGFEEKDLQTPVSSRSYRGGQSAPLTEFIAGLQETYCGSVGAEFMHLQNPRIRDWIQEKLERRTASGPLPVETQERMLRQIMSVESFEHFLHTRYVGQKRFSIEGGESLVTGLYGVLENCPRLGVEEICMGMAHRGRLSVIREFLQKSLAHMFAEFSENYIPNTVGGDGDVKYHLGYKTVREVEGGSVEVRLSANPSHLEAVNPVVEGMARARQRVRGDTEKRNKVVPVLIHGDAAFAGQGIVAETLNMSQLKGYRTGGTVHFIVNNQIGFTTLPEDARSSRYCTDVAKMIEAPVFHVNGDDPLAVRFCSELALEFRQHFNCDVVVDIYCYRRYGHNESDEPLYTQPLMYSAIGEHLSVGTIFRKQLVDGQVITAERAEAIAKETEAGYEAAFAEVKAAEANKTLDKFAGSNARFQPPYSHEPVATAISAEMLKTICRGLTTIPETFKLVPRLRKFFLEKRVQAAEAGGPFDWSYAEAVAFGSLLMEGTPVRLSGQDSRRGTFSQRHAVLYEDGSRERYTPLQHLSPDQARFCVYNSLLSESAVLGFDYGYSLNYRQMLTLWEAQFGDFSNGAQVIIDQFIVSAESKWHRTSGIVLLLPHGYEGQGPEHSSGRLERFLQLCAEDNIQVCNVTTPAQYFHLLRRQMKRPFQKPLVLMTPKSLLRAPECVSRAEDFTQGHFREILPGPEPAEAKGVTRLVFCTGKIFYDLLKYQTEQKVKNTVIVRLEQIYPLHEEAVTALLTKYSKVKHLVWAQEESQNMGAWTHVVLPLRRLAGERLIRYAGRNASASPAVGALGVHKTEQRLVVQDAFTLGD